MAKRAKVVAKSAWKRCRDAKSGRFIEVQTTTVHEMEKPTEDGDFTLSTGPRHTVTASKAKKKLK